VSPFKGGTTNKQGRGTHTKIKKLIQRIREKKRGFLGLQRTPEISKRTRKHNNNKKRSGPLERVRERKHFVRETQTQEVSQRSRGNNLTTGVGHTHMKESEATRVGAHNAQEVS